MAFERSKAGESDLSGLFESTERFDLGLEEFQGGLALSRKYKITLYDAAYIELSRRLKCTFVTADKKLYEKVKSIKSVDLL